MSELNLIQVCAVKRVARAHYLFYTNALDENGVSKEAVILNTMPGVGKIKYLYNYEVGDQVVCLFNAFDSRYYAVMLDLDINDDTLVGFAVGAIFTQFNLPEKSSGNDAEIRFGESKITLKAEEDELQIKCAGDIVMKGKNIQLN